MSVLSKLNTQPMRRNSIILASSMVFMYWSTLKLIKLRDGKLKKRQQSEKSDKTAVNRAFIRKLSKLLKFLLPSMFCVESFYMCVVAASLIARTMADVLMIQLATSIESSIISGSTSLFVNNLAKYISAMPFISLVNNSLKYGIDELKLRFRTRLTKHIYDKYLRSDMTYYKMNNLDSRIANVDQLITQDVEKFCNSLTDLYSNLSKPLLDVFIYAKQLTSTIGMSGLGIILAYLLFSSSFLTFLRKPVARMTVNEQRIEGEFRYINSRIITHCEEIAFYGGHSREELNINESFNKLINHYRNFIFFRFSMGFIDNIIAKYIATFAGYSVVSRPFLNENGKYINKPHKERLEEYNKSARMLIKLAEAIGRISLAGRELTRLAGYTERVTQLMDVLNDLNNGVYERTMIQQSSSIKSNQTNRDQFKPNNGKIIYQDNIIRYENVPLATPNGDILIESLSFEVKSGMNVLVCGPNGCGKSSLFRTLGELWPLFGGVVVKPSQGKLFYIPQKPYMTLGTLRDQIIYPDTLANMKKKRITDKDLMEFLDKVQLTYILDREGGWNSVQDWLDVLSGGEKQRIAMARLFYHRPQFAILDECTSAVSVDVEGYMYDYCKTVGITLFTVSHRKSLWKYHDYYLKMDGRGSYEFKPINQDTEEFGS